MSAAQTRLVIQNELGSRSLNEVFSFIDLDQPLGSATIAQVTQEAPSAIMDSIQKVG